jgi:hypothetical protein
MLAIGLPSPAEFAKNWYFITASEVTMVPANDPNLIEFKKGFMGSAQTADGKTIPQIVGGPPEAEPCRAKVNGIAASAPDQAILIGHDGLFKIWLACTAEAAGHLPAGYTDLVATEAMKMGAVPFYKQPYYWALIAGAGLLGFVLWRRR